MDDPSSASNKRKRKRGRKTKASTASPDRSSPSPAAAPAPAGRRGRKPCRHEAPADVDIARSLSLPRVCGGFGHGRGRRAQDLSLH